MKILIIGAHGHVGQLTTKLLADQGNQVYAAVRDASQNDELAQLGGIPVAYDLMGSVAEMAQVMTTIKPDAIVFTAGSGGRGGQNRTLNIDLDGAVKTMEAAQQTFVKRFVMVSALGTGERDFWADSSIRGYYVAKYYADQWLQLRTNLQYTILRPGTLTDATPLPVKLI
ncbi:NAD(P)H-binding protein [Lapidilactobacillus bayanensis]|uniref:NAD(P)H-binding protein n=1 Tax=Lapidilactobacillus bayanensis TaxID=2485998 RepID=UPI001CDCDDEA|nr:NAD(P)H-binding protein [Lapidilactobacillus bayanensis]